MKWIAPWKIMATFCVCGVLCSLGTIYLPSTVLFCVCGVPFSANVIALVGISVFMAILFPTIYGMALGGLNPKCFKLGGPGMIMAILGGAAVVIGGLLSLVASSLPDGLEWALERVAGTAELEAGGGAYSVASRVQERLSFLPDYAFPGSDSPAGTTVSGLVGGLIVLLLCVGACYGLRLFLRRKRT